jgi:glutamate dehydrogenase/leucine dehydrogenase
MGDTGVDRPRSRMLTTTREDGKAKVAAVGATGQVGRRVVTALIRDGHEVVGISRSTGVDVVADVGLDEVLAGARRRFRRPTPRPARQSGRTAE